MARRLAGYGTIIAADRRAIDLEQPQRIAEQLDALAPDLIVNPAAFTQVDRAEDEKDRAFLINSAGPGVMARWAAAKEVPLVHFSTDYVFDGSGEHRWREDDAARPLNVYGASKLAGERQVMAAAGPRLIVRTSWIYATYGANFLRTMAKKMCELEELRIVADQYGAPTPAPWVADALGTVIERHLDDLPAAFAAAGNILHVAAGGTTTWHAFAERISEGLARRGWPISVRRLVAIPSSDYPTKAVRPLNSRLDLTRLAGVFNIHAPSWDSLLETELDNLTGER